MGTFLISPLRGQKGTDLLQVCPLLLGNEECPHFFPGGRSSEAYGPARLQKWLRLNASRRPVLASSSPRSIRSQRESAAGRRTTRLSQSPLASHCGRRVASLDGVPRGKTPESCAPFHPAEWGHSPLYWHTGTELTTVVAGAWIAVSGSAHGERRVSGVRRAAPLWWFLPDEAR